MKLFKRIYILMFIVICTQCLHAQSTLNLTAIIVDPKCNGGTTGSVTVTASGGRSPYQYQLSESQAGGYYSTNTFAGLSAGTYPVSVKDASNNYKTIYVTLNNPSGITASAISSSASCSSSYDASVTVTPSGGTAPYNYAWTYNTTPITSSNASSNHITGYTTSKIMGPSGKYSVAVTDNNGCSGAVTYYNPDTISTTASSFNQDVIVDSTATSASSSVSFKLDADATGNVLFQNGYKSNKKGLPSSGVVTSAQDNTLQYRFKSYSANNSSRTVNGGVTTLTLTTEKAYAKLFILGTSGNGISTYSYSVNFSDGTTYPGNASNNIISFRDWFGSTGSDIALVNLNRVQLNSNSSIDTKNYALYEAPIIIPAPYFNKTIKSVTLTNTSTVGSAGNIFALSGFQASGTASNVGYATSGVSTPSVTITSSMDSMTNYYCAGQTITYTANTIHGGASPTYQVFQSTNNGAYQQVTLNSSNSTSNTYTVTPAAGTTTYSIKVVATASTDACVANVNSDTTIFTGTQHSISPTVSITGSTNICQGSNAVYNITNQTNAGSTPTYTWLVDGTTNTSLGNGTTANTNSLTTGTHTIAASMKSSIGCASNNPVTSTNISTVVNNSPTPAVTISNLNNAIPITFNIASSSNLGTAPSYQWYLNGDAIANATNSTYTTNNNTVSGDNYSLKVTSNATCASPATLMSNYRTVATALPIILKSFSLTSYTDKISVDWQTSMEVNTDKYEILRKYEDSSDFKAIASIKATNNFSGSTYQYWDYPSLSGSYQYKLKTYDLDGTYQLSNIQSIYYGNIINSQSNKVFPNPFTDHLNITLTNGKIESGSLLLINFSGVIVKTRNIQITNGTQNYSLENLSGLPSGIYICKIVNSSAKEIYSTKVIKK